MSVFEFLDSVSRTVEKLFIDVELLIHANEIQTPTGSYYRAELKDSFDILKRLYLESEG